MYLDKNSQEYKFTKTLGDMTYEEAKEFGMKNNIEEIESCRIVDLQDCIYYLLNNLYKGLRVRNLCITPLRGEWVSVWGNVN